MRNIYLSLTLLFSLILTYNSLTAQERVSSNSNIISAFPWIENFETGYWSGNWTQSAQPGNISWILKEEKISGIPEGSFYTTYSSYVYLDGLHDQSQKLITPEFDLSGLSEPVLFFRFNKSSASYRDTLKIYYKMGRDTVWSLLDAIDDGSSRWTERTVSLAQIPVTAPVRFAFEVRTYMGNLIGLDDVMVGSDHCGRIPEVGIFDISSNSARLRWESYGEDRHWLLSYRNLTQAQWGSDILLSTPEYDFGNTPLQSATHYQVKIQQVCGEEETGFPRFLYFTTACESACLPLFETFDIFSPGNNMDAPACWSLLKTGGGQGLIQQAEYHSSPYAYCLRSSLDVTESIALLSPYFTDNIRDLQVSFYAKSYSYEGSGDIEVGYLTDADDLETFVPYTRIFLTENWQSYSVSFENITAEAHRMVFRHANNIAYNPIYLDDIIIESIPGCVTHIDSLRVVDKQTSLLTIQWKSQPNTGYDLRYSLAGTTDWIVRGNVTPPFVLRGLENSRSYQFSLRTVCDGETGAWTLPMQEWTAEKIPFIDNFDELTARDWRIVKNRLSPGTVTVSEYPDSHVSYPRAMVLQSGSGRSADHLWYVTPEMDPNVNFRGLQIRFKAKASVPGSVLSLGFMDADDLHSFRLMESIPLTSEWTTYVVRFQNYTGLERRLAFGHNGNLPGTAIYIDNIALEKISYCREVSHISSSCAQGDGFVLNWKDIGSTLYYIEYKITGTDVYLTEIADTHSFTFTGLEEATEYTVRVGENCRPFIWSDTVVINTSVKPDTMPFVENFEIGPEWIIDNGNQPNRWVVGYDTNANDNGGSRSLYIAHEDVYQYDMADASIVYAYKNLLLDEVGDYRIKYEWKNGNSSGFGSNNYMQAWLVPDGVPFRSGMLPRTEGWIKVSNTAKLINQSDWKEEVVVVPIENPGVYHLVFCWHNDGRSGNLPPGAVDNIEITRILCATPRNMEIISVTKNKLDIRITHPVNTEFIRFYYKIGDENFWTDSVDHPMLLRTNLFSLTDLDPATEYVMACRTFCSPHKASSMSIPVTFRTGCEETPIPWYETFDLSVFPPNECWKRKEYLFDPDYPMYEIDFQDPDPLGAQWELGNIFGNNAASVDVYFQGQNNWLISPEIKLGEKSDYYLQMDVKYLSRNQNQPAYLDQFIALVSLDAGTTWDPANATIWQNDPRADYPLDNLNRHYQTLTVPLLDMDSIIKVAFYTGSESYGENNVFYLDNISIADCPRPLDLSIEYANYDSIVAKWNTYGNGNSWGIKYGLYGFDPDTVDAVIIHDTVFNMTGLEANTVYDIYVRTLCGSSSSVWVKSTFQTPCVLITEFPYLETFEPDSTFHCWRIKNENGDESSWGISDYKPYHGGNAIRFDTDPLNNYDDDYLISPPVELTGNEFLYFYVSSLDPDFPRSYQVLISSTPEFLRDKTIILLEDTASTVAYKAMELDLTVYSGVFYIAFHIPGEGIRHSTLFIDEFSIEPQPTCKRPVDLSYISDEPGFLELKWLERNGAVLWEIEYGPLTFNQGDENAVRMYADTNPYTLLDIEEIDYYEFYVRSVCGVGDTSKWSGRVVFSPYCSPITQYPYSQDFEYFGMTPPCWKDEVLQGTVKWEFKSGVDGQLITTPYSGAINAAIMGNIPTYYRNRLVSPVFDLSQLNRPYITFWYALFASFNNHDNLKLYYRNNLSDSWTLLKDFETTNTWKFDSIPLINPSATYQIAFEGSSNTYPAYGSGIDQLYIGQVSVSPCIIPVNLDVTFITQHSALVSWDPDSHEGPWILAYKADHEQTYREITCEEPYYELTGLEPNTLYHIWIKSICSEGQSFPSISEFHTREEGVVFHHIHVTSLNVHVEPVIEIVPVEHGHSQKFDFITENGQGVTVVVNNSDTYYNINTYTFENVRADSGIYVTLFNIGIPDVEAGSPGVKVFPNPAGQVLNVLTDIFFDQIQIMNVLGEVIFYDRIDDRNIRLDISALQSGIYLVRLSGPEGISITKFIKE